MGEWTSADGNHSDLGTLLASICRTHPCHSRDGLLLNEMSVEDQEWLNTNSLYYSVTAPLWVEGDADAHVDGTGPVPAVRVDP